MIIGVDPYKSVNAVAAIDGDGELLGHEVFPANRAGLRKLERWAKRFSAPLGGGRSRRHRASRSAEARRLGRGGRRRAAQAYDEPS